MSEIAVDPLLLDDYEGALPLLRAGFPEFSENYWERLHDRIARLHRPPDFEQIGYLLRVDGAAAGVILTFFSERYHEGKRAVLGNVSTWYVDPKHRSLAVLMLKKLSAVSGVNFTNFSPLEQVVPLFKACGFRALASGVMFVPPFLNPETLRQRASITEASSRISELEPWEQRMVRDHLTLGCVCLAVEDEAGVSPLIFTSKRTKGVKLARLVFARNQAILERYPEQLNLALLRRGFLGFGFDAERKPDTVRGFFRPVASGKLYKGDYPGFASDIAYSERVILFDLNEDEKR